MEKYFIITYGCQMNKSDSERIAQVLENIGYLPALNTNEADLILVNACSVRQSAIDRIWGQVAKFKKLKIRNKKLRTILTGCVVKEDKNKFKNKFDAILDIQDLSKLPEKLLTGKLLISPSSSDRINWEKIEERTIGKEAKDYFKIKPKYQSPFSAYVPIMTGCNNFCSFCVVPYTRGREISRPAEEIICEVENLVKRGYREIWLLGQNVNSYRGIFVNRGNAALSSTSDRALKRPVANFPLLLKLINDIPGNFWIRFTSSHPKDLSEELIETMKNCQKVTEYLNLPVQSGDNEILKKMNRPYTIEQYKNLVQKIRKEIPNIALSTDVIVGFPGETEKQFKNTIKLFKEIKFDMAYIAQYSPRPETVAAKLGNNVPHQEKEKRWKILSDILKETVLEKNKKYIGKTVEVLPEENKNGFLIGKTRTYKTVKFEAKADLIGQFVKVKILKSLPWGLGGKLIS